MRKKQITQFLSLVILLCSINAQDSKPTQTNLTLNQLLNVSSLSSGVSYYSVNFQLEKDTAKLLMITAQSQQEQVIGIYTSINYDGVGDYYQFPNSTNNTNFCSYSTIDSCAIILPEVKQGQTKNVTVYIGVQIYFSSSLTILTALQDIYPAKVGINYDIDFKVWESAVLTLSAAQVNQYEQVLLQMQYDTFNIGKFSLYAGIDKIPGSFDGRIESRYVGAFTQVLILNPIQQNQTYYILVEGQKGTEFDLLIKPFSTSSPQLQINKTIFYYSTSKTADQESLAFQLSLNYFQEEEILPLFVDLNSLGGYGQFQVNYCDGLTNFTFININGQMGQLIIPVQERKQCYKMIYDKGGLMIQNLIVTIEHVAWYFSYSIGIFEGQFPLMLSPYNEKIGTLISDQQSRIYQIQAYINESFVLKYKTISGQSQLNFTLFECHKSILLGPKCKKLLNSNQDAQVDQLSPEYNIFNFTSLQSKHYKLVISHNSEKPFDSEYVLLLQPLNPKPSILMPSKPKTMIIQENEYQYYIVNLTLISKTTNLTIDNTTNIIITMTQTTGYCLLLTSLVEESPIYQKIFQPNSTVDYSWSGRRQFNVDSNTQAIYVGVLGAAQSIYHLQVVVQVNQDLPEKYTRLVSDKLLTYTLSAEQKQDHILLSYTAHSIPYMIIISPTPSCIVYSYDLPITDTTCRQLPSQLTEKVIYFKIYRNFSDESSKVDDGKDFKFQIYVYSGSHYLFQYSPVLIACQDSCYQYVSVYVPEKINIVHRGMGYISKKESEDKFSNQKMEITCQKQYPCFLSINASLPWGGDMELFYESTNIQQVQWITKPLTFQSAYDPKYFYMQIRHWSSLNTAIFYTEGISVTVYYDIYAMKQNATNAMQYGFPSQYWYTKKSQGNPLRRFHIVQFDQQLIQSLGCKDQNEICIATLAVYPNLNAEYSSGYIQTSVGFYSSNTFRYYIPMNSPYQLSEDYSLTYFRHEFSEDQWTNLAPFYYVKVQPLSSCRPQIFAPFDSSNESNFATNMPYYGNYKVDSKTLDSSSKGIQFTISTDQSCEFMVWLLNNDVKPVISNTNYELQSDQNGSVMVVFSDKYLWNDRKFSIDFDQQMNEIIIDKYQTYPNGSIKLPTANAYLAYVAQSRQLRYASADYTQTLYVIKASTNVNSKVNLKVSSYESQTIILTNSQTRFTFSQQTNEVAYRYYSNNDFAMFVTTDSGQVQLTVTDWKRDDRNVVDTILDDQSSPWVQVKAVKGDIRQYYIKLSNVLLKSNGRNLQTTKYPKINLHIEETGVIGLPQLYDGVALFDAFYQEDSQNCYKYLTEPIVGRPSLRVDLIFGSQFINALPNITGKMSIASAAKTSFNWTKIPTGYRMQTNFYGNEVYQFCFSINHQQALVSKQYYVMVENIAYSLKHLTLDVPMSSHYPASYEIFEYVATQDQNLMIQVVNCFGKSTLLGAKQYSDIYLGQVSELGSFYRDQTLSIAMKNLSLGYFYFGIKLNDTKDRYKIRVELLEQNQTIHYNNFELKQTKITKAKTVEQNGKQSVRVNLPKVSVLNLSKQVTVHHIDYYLLVDDLKSGQEYESNVIAKCPILGNKKLISYKFTHNYVQSAKIEGSFEDQQVAIDVPLSQVPQIFNLTGYAEISISHPYTQTLTYYYESTSFRLKADDSKGLSAFTILFIIGLISGSLVIVYIVYRRWKQRRQQAKIAFEMATYNHENYDQNNQTQNPQIKQSASPTNSPQKALKKPLNDNVGYGQFVDQNA